MPNPMREYGAESVQQKNDFVHRDPGHYANLPTASSTFFAFTLNGPE